MKSNLHKLSFLIIGIFIAIGTSYLNAWTGPTQTAPNGNVDAPVNLSVLSQVKLGGLSVASLLATGAVGASQYCDALGQNCVTPPFIGNNVFAYGVVASNGTLLSGHNIQSVTRAYTGGYSIQFSSSHPQSTYPIIITTGSGDDNYATIYSQNSLGFSLNTFDGPSQGFVGYEDVSFYFVVFGGSGGSVLNLGQWVDVPMNDSSGFDGSCEYRARMTTSDNAYATVPTTLYFNGINSDNLIYVSHSAVTSYINKNNKSQWMVNGSIYPGVTISFLQKRC